MAKLTSFIAPEGKKTFEAKPAKDTITPRRQKIADGIDRVLEAIKAGEDKVRGGIYEVREGVAKATVRLGSRHLVLEGQEAFYVAKDKLAEFYTEVKKQVLGGEHDDAIRALDGKPEKGGAVKSERKAGNYGWSEERKAKFKATKARQREEREAAKAAAK